MQNNFGCKLVAVLDMNKLKLFNVNCNQVLTPLRQKL